MSKYESDLATDLETLAEMFKALSNPHRLSLFNRLLTCCVPGTVCDVDTATHFNVGQLGEGIDIAPSTLSHHLKELNRAGLIQMQRKGQQVECWVEPSILKEIGSFFNQKNRISK
ncbi:MAG: helix-turn-helix domain-containing protein [Chromatiales bacterium]|nr:helix-turn-helix domain-containing protein [Chromatiales bacterium]